MDERNQAESSTSRVPKTGQGGNNKWYPSLERVLVDLRRASVATHTLSLKEYARKYYNDPNTSDENKAKLEPYVLRYDAEDSKNSKSMKSKRLILHGGTTNVHQKYEQRVRQVEKKKKLIRKDSNDEDSGMEGNWYRSNVPSKFQTKIDTTLNNRSKVSSKNEIDKATTQDILTMMNLYGLRLTSPPVIPPSVGDNIWMEDLFSERLPAAPQWDFSLADRLPPFDGMVSHRHHSSRRSRPARGVAGIPALRVEMEDTLPPPFISQPCGIDSSLFLESVDDITCPICLEVLDQPIIACINNHTFCSECIAWQRRSNIVQRFGCPLCKVPLELRPMLCRETAKKVEDRKRKCKNSRDGCDFQEKHGLTQRHEKKCIYRKEICEEGECKAVVLWKNVEDHRKVCPFVMVDCPNGNSRVNECPKMRRLDMAKHDEICPHIRCTNYFEGCHFKGKKYQVKEHETTYCNQLFRQLRNLTITNLNLKEQNEILQSELEKLKKAISGNVTAYVQRNPQIISVTEENYEMAMDLSMDEQDDGGEQHGMENPIVIDD